LLDAWTPPPRQRWLYPLSALTHDALPNLTLALHSQQHCIPNLNATLNQSCLLTDARACACAVHCRCSVPDHGPPVTAPFVAAQMACSQATGRWPTPAAAPHSSSSCSRPPCPLDCLRRLAAGGDSDGASCRAADAWAAWASVSATPSSGRALGAPAAGRSSSCRVGPPKHSQQRARWHHSLVRLC
jgi:hypothetical protein